MFQQQYVDIFEIFLVPEDRKEQKNRQQIIFKAYNQGEWYGKIKEIIPSFNGELDSRFVIPSFGLIRPKCHKRCAYNPNVCKICNSCEMVAETLKKHRLTVQRITKMSTVSLPNASS